MKKLFFALVFITNSLLPREQEISLHYTDISGELKSQSVLVDDFVKNFMIRFKCIYTLFGMKPITEFDLHYNPSIEKLKKEYESMSESENKWGSLESYLSDISWSTSFKKQWLAFEKETKKINMKEHFFVECLIQYEDVDEPYNTVFFVHEPTCLKLLSDYQALFESELGIKFDPAEKIKELKEGNLTFWNRFIRDRNHLLMGLVFGFGEKNSYYFRDEMKGDKSAKAKREFHTSLEDMAKAFRWDATIEDLGLPGFVSYPADGVDKTVEKYRTDREFILEYMKDKDLREEVFRILSGENNTVGEINKKRF